jgi:hypothetical protein
MVDTTQVTSSQHKRNNTFSTFSSYSSRAEDKYRWVVEQILKYLQLPACKIFQDAFDVYINPRDIGELIDVFRASANSKRGARGEDELSCALDDRVWPRIHGFLAR